MCSLGPSDAVDVAALGCADALVGRTGGCSLASDVLALCRAANQPPHVSAESGETS